jgi:hypothetical protein
MISEEIVERLTRLETTLGHVEQALGELKGELKTNKQPVLPTAGGVAGLVAAAWTGYLQARGQA